MSYKVLIVDKKNKCGELFTTYSEAAKYINKHPNTVRGWKDDKEMVELDDFLVLFNISFNKLNRGDVRNFTKRVNNW